MDMTTRMRRSLNVLVSGATDAGIYLARSLQKEYGPEYVRGQNELYETLKAQCQAQIDTICRCYGREESETLTDARVELDKMADALREADQLLARALSVAETGRRDGYLAYTIRRVLYPEKDEQPMIDPVFNDNTPCTECGGFGVIATRDPNVGYRCRCTARKKTRRADHHQKRDGRSWKGLPFS